MGLDISVIGTDPEDEIDTIRVGQSSDFDQFRRTVSHRLDSRTRSTRFPMLMRDTVWNCSWDAADCAVLEQELGVIATELSRLPHEPQAGLWSENSHSRVTEPASLLESFVTIDGELFVPTHFIRARRAADGRPRRRRLVLSPTTGGGQNDRATPHTCAPANASPAMSRGIELAS